MCTLLIAQSDWLHLGTLNMQKCLNHNSPIRLRLKPLLLDSFAIMILTVHPIFFYTLYTPKLLVFLFWFSRCRDKNIMDCICTVIMLVLPLTRVDMSIQHKMCLDRNFHVYIATCIALISRFPCYTIHL